MEKKYLDFYSDNKEEILKEFKSQFEPEEMSENDDVIFEYYEKELGEMIIEWYNDHINILNSHD